MNNQLSPFDAIVKDPKIRRTVAYQSHQLFFPIYFPHYIIYPMAEFQKSILRLTEDEANTLALVVAFRGSAKSTLVTLSYVLWSILGKQQKKYVVILCQTQQQARQHMTNLKKELEQNTLLKSDLGPFQEDSGGDWALSSLVFKNMNARITVASMEQSIRGTRHNQHRPDLIILDDIEDVNSTKTSDGRNKTFEWFTREIMPLGDLKTRILLVGNLLHEDSLMMRLKKKIENGELTGLCLWYPLIDEKVTCLWPEKFDNPDKIEELHGRVANELAWQQEYLLKIAHDHMRVVQSDWIQYYDHLPPKSERRSAATSVDLAISDRETADYTAVLTGSVYGYGETFGIYIHPNPINERLNFPDIVSRLSLIDDEMRKQGNHSLLVEDVGYQRSVIQQLKQYKIYAKGIGTEGADKRTRLSLVSELVRLGVVKFPRTGCETLIAQLTGFGNERHDDLADAFSMLMKELQTISRVRPVKRHASESETITGNLMEQSW